MLEYIQKYKTGALFASSLVMGAILGGTDSKKTETLRKFAYEFGILFQMADDILDVISTADEMGKKTGKDKDENKLTYIAKFGLNGAKEKLISQKKTCYDILKADGIESEVFYEILESITKKII